MTFVVGFAPDGRVAWRTQARGAGQRFGPARALLADRDRARPARPPLQRELPGAARDGDVLVVGGSAIGPVARVLLGSRASKIVRHSPVPVVVVPWS